MKRITLISFFIFLFACFHTSAQTGYFTFDDLEFDSQGWAIKPANDGNIISVFDSFSGFIIKKITSEGVELWSTYAEDYMHPFYAHALFSIPGDGYYFFTTWTYYHFSEDGDILSAIPYTLTDLGYTDGEFESDDPYFQSVCYTGTAFHILSSQFDPAHDTLYYTVTEVDMEGTVAYSRYYYKAAWPEGTESRITFTDGYDYIFYGYNDGDSLHLIYKEDIINASTGLRESEKYYDFIELRGIHKQEDGIIEYGINEYAGSATDLNEFIKKTDAAGETLWSHAYTIDLGYSTFMPNLSELIELESGNLLGLVSFAVPYGSDTDYHALQLFSSEGNLLSTSPVFKITNHSFPWFRSNIHAMTLLGDNLIGFTGGDAMDHSFVLLTDTLGTYYHVNLTGRLYNDANGNNVFDADEIVYPDRIINTEPISYFAVTDEDGKYDLMVGNDGTYSINTDSILYWDIIEPDDHYNFIADTSLSGDTISGYDFRYDYSIPVHDVSITLYQSNIAPGFESHNTFTIKNNGNQYNESGSAILHFPSILQEDYTVPDYFSLGDTVISWNYDDLDPYEILSYDAYYTADTLLYMIGETVLTSAHVTVAYPEMDTDNNYDSVYTVITASYDPNHKSVSPAGDGDGGNISDDTEYLTYTIEFQNTGTAEAHFINIYDTLDDELDMATIEMLAASHQYKLYLTAPNIVRWEFDSIFLPDSTTDLMGSMGYLKFRIKIKTDATSGDEIENTAAIYFDFNTAILTNTTKNTLIHNTEIINSADSPGLLLYPNPVSKYLTINLTNVIEGNMLVVLSDMSGKIIMRRTLRPGINSATLDVSALSPGFYHCSVYNGSNKIVSAGKFEVFR